MFKSTFIFALIIIILSSACVFGSSSPDENSPLNINQEELLKEYIDKIEALEIENQILKERNAYIERLLKEGLADRVPVLTYHHLYNGDLETSVFKNTNTVISVEAFAEQMKYLKENNYYTANLQELEIFLKGEGNLPKKTVVITFDDGYRSNIELAYPILKEYGFKATIFVIGEHIGASSWFTYVNQEDFKNTTDVFQFENHTNKLHHVVKGKALLVITGKERLKEDFMHLKDLLGTQYFSYPYGIYNETAISALKETEHRMAFTTKYGYVTRKSNLFQLPRLGISPRTTLNEFISIVKPK